jgi:hypothetical protein
MTDVKKLSLEELRKEMHGLLNPTRCDWSRRKEVNKELRNRLKGQPGWTGRQ